MNTQDVYSNNNNNNKIFIFSTVNILTWGNTLLLKLMSDFTDYKNNPIFDRDGIFKTLPFAPEFFW